MRYSILGFNQEEVLKIQKLENEKHIKLDITDLMILKYIVDALGRPSMKHYIEDDVMYVWIHHTKLLEDLPILDIKANMLSKRLKKLTDLELIESKVISNNKARGSKAYYTITSLCESLLYTKSESEDTTRCKKLQVEKRPDVKNYKSNNLLTNKTILSKDNIVENSTTSVVQNTKNNNFEFGKPKQKKQSLYSKCISLINGFTSDIKLRKLLVEFLNNCLENSRESNTPFYTNNFKGKLNALAKFKEEERLEIVQLTLDKGWNNFYKPNNNSNNNNTSFINVNEGVRQVTDMNELKLEAERRRKDGKQVYF